MILNAIFYNFNYNHGAYDGSYKYSWGINWFDLSLPLVPQLIEKAKLDAEKVFNLNLTAFNQFNLQKDNSEFISGFAKWLDDLEDKSMTAADANDATKAKALLQLYVDSQANKAG